MKWRIESKPSTCLPFADSLSSDDEFIIHLYGAFRGSFAFNATIDLTVDCGSHCEEYGAPPGETPGETVTVDFCEVSEIEQPSGGGRRRNETCPPVEGYALISSPAYVVPMFFSTPVSAYLVSRLGFSSMMIP